MFVNVIQMAEGRIQKQLYSLWIGKCYIGGSRYKDVLPNNLKNGLKK